MLFNKKFFGILLVFIFTFFAFSANLFAEDWGQGDVGLKINNISLDESTKILDIYYSSDSDNLIYCAIIFDKEDDVYFSKNMFVKNKVSSNFKNVENVVLDFIDITNQNKGHLQIDVSELLNNNSSPKKIVTYCTQYIFDTKADFMGATNDENEVLKKYISDNLDKEDDSFQRGGLFNRRSLFRTEEYVFKEPNKEASKFVLTLDGSDQTEDETEVETESDIEDTTEIEEVVSKPINHISFLEVSSDNENAICSNGICYINTDSTDLFNIKNQVNFDDGQEYLVHTRILSTGILQSSLEDYILNTFEYSNNAAGSLTENINFIDNAYFKGNLDEFNLEGKLGSNQVILVATSYKTDNGSTYTNYSIYMGADSSEFSKILLYEANRSIINTSCPDCLGFYVSSSIISKVKDTLENTQNINKLEKALEGLTCSYSQTPIDPREIRTVQIPANDSEDENVEVPDNYVCEETEEVLEPSGDLIDCFTMIKLSDKSVRDDERKLISDSNKTFEKIIDDKKKTSLTFLETYDASEIKIIFDDVTDKMNFSDEEKAVFWANIMEESKFEVCEPDDDSCESVSLSQVYIPYWNDEDEYNMIEDYMKILNPNITYDIYKTEYIDTALEDERDGLEVGAAIFLYMRDKVADNFKCLNEKTREGVDTPNRCNGEEDSCLAINTAFVTFYLYNAGEDELPDFTKGIPEVGSEYTIKLYTKSEMENAKDSKSDGILPHHIVLSSTRKVGHYLAYKEYYSGASVSSTPANNSTTTGSSVKNETTTGSSASNQTSTSSETVEKELEELKNPENNYSGNPENYMTIGGSIDNFLKEVNPDRFPDPALRECVATHYQLGGLENIESLDCNSYYIKNLQGIEYLKYLKTVYLASGDEIENLYLLSNLEYLKNLDIDSYGQVDTSFLLKLSNLNYLSLRGLENFNVSHLANLNNLKTLNLNYSTLINYSELSNLTNLSEFDAMSSNITDISFISNLTKLEILNLCYNSITDISPISNLTSLSNLSLCGIKNIDISSISNLTNLNNLNLHSCSTITDISYLSGLTNLSSLDVSYNKVSDLSPLFGISNLNYLDVRSNNLDAEDIKEVENNLTGLLNFYHDEFEEVTGTVSTQNQSNSNSNSKLELDLENKFPDVGFRVCIDKTLQKSTVTDPNYIFQTITELDCHSFSIKSIEGINHLPNLTTLNLAGNEISDINPLKALYKLEYLDLEKNKLNHDSCEKESWRIFSNVNIDNCFDHMANLKSLDISFNTMLGVTANKEILEDLPENSKLICTENNIIKTYVNK